MNDVTRMARARALRHRVFVGVAVLALPAATLGIGRGAAQAAGPVCSVPGDYATIQGAVNDNACTTIDVASGPRTETTTVTRGVTIKGAQAGVAAPGRVAPESEVTGATPTGNVATFTI